MAIHSEERARLESLSEKSLYSAGVQERVNQYCFEILKRFVSPEGAGALLEMGPAEGVMTERLATLRWDSMTLVEASELFCRSLEERFPEARVENKLFEEFEPEGTFDLIVLGHVLEHVADPEDVLRRAASWLAPGGRIFAAVPNARSLHRQAAVLMGLLPQEDALNEMDIRHGHRRVFSPEGFRRLFLKVGLTIATFGGYWLKTLSNRQIEESWSPAMVDAFLRLGEWYPDIAGEMYVVACPDSRREMR